MTTSSKNLKLKPKPQDGHWQEFSATLSVESTDQFDRWMSKQLSNLEERLRVFGSPRSLHKSLRG